MRLTRLIPLIVSFLVLYGCSQLPATTASDYPLTSLEEIAQSLPTQPIAVGFDVDDTLLFSSPAFYYVAYNQDGAEGSNKYGPRPFDNPQARWDINNQFDRFSLPKKVGHALIELHKKRGDSIYFITARQPSETEQLSHLLARVFSVASPAPVIFSGDSSKAIPIRTLKIELFYGDSDADIREAQEAGARAIRILRAPNSTDPRPLRLGGFGESVLENSAY